MNQTYKFQNLSDKVHFSQSQIQYINNLSLESGKEWDKKDSVMDTIKADIKSQLEKIQGGYCIYCGLSMDIVGPFDREHIVIKSKYPEFMFEPFNLVLACKTCNGSTRKGQKDVLAGKKNSQYVFNNFKIIHPHLDKREEHIELSENHCTLRPKNNSEKGKNTIEMFDLNNTGLLSIRGQQYITSCFPVSNSMDEIIRKITEFYHSVY